ncbi:Protein FAR1-RELATED SEQUENCE 7 [Abeliophyllum distichum]|uniref:Protein FAR1-RELATED SEQUENCE 7 n=1 Tax=Abeliophyllum distichum TaxID=126358 RepID=A0ABD1QLE5_9LAMI
MGKWILDNIRKEHYHELKDTGENCTTRIQRKNILRTGGAGRTGIKSDEDDGLTVVVDVKRFKIEELDGVGAHLQLNHMKIFELNSANEAYKVSICQIFCSKHDGSITSRRFCMFKERASTPFKSRLWSIFENTKTKIGKVGS